MGEWARKNVNPISAGRKKLCCLPSLTLGKKKASESGETVLVLASICKKLVAV